MTNAQTLIDSFYAQFVPLEIRWHEKFGLSQSERDKVADKMEKLRDQLGEGLLALEQESLHFGDSRRYPAPYGSSYIELHWKVHGVVPKRFKAEARAWLNSLGVEWQEDAHTIRTHVEAALASKDPSLPGHRFEIVKPTVTTGFDPSPQKRGLAEMFQELEEFRARTVNPVSG